MMSDEMRARLNDYVDDLLSEADRRKVEAVLAEDANAREEVAFLQQLARDAQQLPKTVAPARDLWDGIVGGIEPEVSAKSFVTRQWAWLGVAAVLLVAVSSTLTAFWMQQTMSPVVQVEHREEDRPMLAQMEPYHRAIEQLKKTLNQRRGALTPETVAAVEANLQVIDEAMSAARLALVSDPHNQQAAHTLLAMYRETVKLQQVVALPNGG